MNLQNVPLILNQQKVLFLLNNYLISDLSGLVLRYCWPANNKKKYIYKVCLYGNYEKMLAFYLCDEDDEDDEDENTNTSTLSYSDVPVALTSGAYSTAVGSDALITNISDAYITAVGYNALSATTTGYNTAVGHNALSAITNDYLYV